MKIGLLGGSFNPAHPGHLHISNIALKKLRLHQIWWLVSPQNPLKSKTDMMDYKSRFEQAQEIAGNNPRIKVSSIEKEIGTTYTIDTIKHLKQKFPQVEFVWIMGADNLIQLPKWKNWEEILKLIPMHVFDRAEYFYKATGSIAYRKHRDRISYHKTRKNPYSSTAIRLTKR